MNTFKIVFIPRLCFLYTSNVHQLSVRSMILLDFSLIGKLLYVSILHSVISICRTFVTRRNNCLLLRYDSSITSLLIVAAATAAATTSNNSKCITPWDAQLRAITPWSNPASCYQTLPDASSEGEHSTIDAYGSCQHLVRYEPEETHSQHKQGWSCLQLIEILGKSR